MPSLLLKPWARESTEDTSLKDVLARVNLERGHFRDITEASLQEEIAREGALELSESEDEEEGEKDDGDQGDGGPKTYADLVHARNEMLQHVGNANQDAMMALDFVSLLLSKEAPAAGSSISQALRHEVPTGSLGVDIWQRMPADKARETQDERIATGVRMEGLQETADGLMAAANRLQDNVRRETQYWNRVLSITDKGWNLCRIPGQQHKLGVTFGFSESAPQFSRRGIVALNARDDGSIALERGIGSKPKAMRVLIKREGKVIGSSPTQPLADGAEAELESRIRHARDSLFDEELYHEMIREARTQTSFGVSMLHDAITFQPGSLQIPNAPEVLFQLVTLSNDTNLPAGSAHDDDAWAQALALAARLLLGQAHHERLKKRSEVPPPVSDKKEERSIVPILRPIMSFILHRCALEQVHVYLGRVSTLLSAAEIHTAWRKAGFSFTESSHATTAESLVTQMTQPWQSEATLTMTHGAITPIELRVQIETTLSYHSGTIFTLATPDQRNFRVDSFDDLRNAADTALSRALAHAIAEIAGDQWVCQDRVAVLTRREDVSGQANRVWVAVDGAAPTLSLRSPHKERTWTAEGATSQDGAAGLWRAWDDIIS